MYNLATFLGYEVVILFVSASSRFLIMQRVSPRRDLRIEADSVCNTAKIDHSIPAVPKFEFVHSALGKTVGLTVNFLLTGGNIPDRGAPHSGFIRTSKLPRSLDLRRQGDCAIDGGIDCIIFPRFLLISISYVPVFSYTYFIPYA